MTTVKVGFISRRQAGTTSDLIAVLSCDILGFLYFKILMTNI